MSDEFEIPAKWVLDRFPALQRLADKLKAAQNAEREEQRTEHDRHQAELAEVRARHGGQLPTAGYPSNPYSVTRHTAQADEDGWRVLAAAHVANKRQIHAAHRRHTREAHAELTAAYHGLFDRGELLAPAVEVALAAHERAQVLAEELREVSAARDSAVHVAEAVHRHSNPGVPHYPIPRGDRLRPDDLRRFLSDSADGGQA